MNKTPPPGEIDNTPLGERHTRSSKRGEAAIARLRTDGRKSAQCRRGLRCALMLSGNKNVQYTRKSAQFRSGFWRCLRRALVASGCENGRTVRKSTYFVRPCAVPNTYSYSVKKRAKNAKNGGVKIAACVCLWAEMSTTPVSGRRGWGGGFFRAVSAEWGGRSLPVFRLSSLVLNKKREKLKGKSRCMRMY